eukprot:TRINITY_DN13956_c2_g1_i1.p1 TRINITY_DN13956_c2_g1~~TRINITY_DN13956_c2_g1_i1.p1  ORF type:complete len:886 (+),score=258.34 TRINITY_DN13956_c2_g1_i1:54-2711(+)
MDSFNTPHHQHYHMGRVRKTPGGLSDVGVRTPYGQHSQLMAPLRESDFITPAPASIRRHGAPVADGMLAIGQSIGIGGSLAGVSSSSMVDGGSLALGSLVAVPPTACLSPIQKAFLRSPKKGVFYSSIEHDLEQRQRLEEKISGLKKEANELLRSGKVDTAIEHGLSCLRSSVRVFGKDHPELLYTLIVLGEAYIQKGMTEQAETQLLHARRLAQFSDAGVDMYVLLGQCLLDLCHIYRIKNRHRKALDIARELVEVRERQEMTGSQGSRLRGRWREDTLSAHILLAVCLWHCGEMGEAMDELLRARDLLQTYSTGQLVSNVQIKGLLATVYNNVGNVLLAQGYLEPAIQEYEEGRNMLEGLIDLLQTQEEIDEEEEDKKRGMDTDDDKEEEGGQEVGDGREDEDEGGMDARHLEETKSERIRNRTQWVINAREDLGICLANLGTAFWHMNNLHKALEMFEASRSIRVSVFGEVHEQTAQCDILIGSVLIAWRRMDEAVVLFQRAREIREKFRGVRSAETISAMLLEGHAYRFAGDSEGAMRLYLLARTTATEVFGEAHDLVMVVDLQIASLHLAEGKSHAALYYYLKWAKRKRSRRRKGKQTKSQSQSQSQNQNQRRLVSTPRSAMRTTVASSYSSSSSFTHEDSRYRHHSSGLHHVTWADDRPSSSPSSQTLASSAPSALGMGDLGSPSSPARKASMGLASTPVLSSSRSHVSSGSSVSEHDAQSHNVIVSEVHVGALYNDMGNVLRQQGRLREAMLAYDQAKEIFEDLYGSDHENIAVVLTNIGHVQLHQARHDSCLRLYQRVNVMRIRMHGMASLETASSFLNLAIVEQRLGLLDTAHEHILQYGKCVKDIVGKDHPLYVQAKSRIARLIRKRDLAFDSTS